MTKVGPKGRAEANVDFCAPLTGWFVVLLITIVAVIRAPFSNVTPYGVWLGIRARLDLMIGDLAPT
jgi:hypothetical protein